MLGAMYPDKSPIEVGDVVKLSRKGQSELTIIGVDETMNGVLIYLSGSDYKRTSYGIKTFLSILIEKVE